MDAAKQRLRPLDKNSIMAVVSTVLSCIKQHVTERLQKPSIGGPSKPYERASVIAEDVLVAIKQDPLGTDLALALLSMAASSYR